MKNPCRPECKYRTPTCHVICKYYESYREAKNEEMEARAAMAAAFPTFNRATKEYLWKQMKG